ncbi:MAG: UvrD-helicase domain-containing protein [Clostridia bacterium]|nr:UvrD-helicase domain-containing protein [Clostridia bacterium]
MPKIAYTPAQKRAVFYPDGNLLLSAAAGSGKTAALTGRIVELIAENRAELSEMLIVTFTKAAAGEMKTRIAKKVRERMEEVKGTDAQTTARLSHALTQLPSADISTIHSFLYQTLRPYFPALGLSADASIGEAQEFDKMKAEVMRDVTDDFFAGHLTAENAQDFVQLADTIGQARDTTAVDAELLWLAERLANMGEDVSVLLSFAEELEKNARADVAESAYGKIAAAQTLRFVKHYRGVFDSFADEFETDVPTAEKYGAALGGILGWLADAYSLLTDENPSYAALCTHFSAYTPVPLGRLAAKNASETSKNFKYFRDLFHKELKALTADYYVFEPDAFPRAAQKTAQILRTAHSVIAVYEKRLTQRKQALSLMEYGDLERYAAKIFIGENGERTEAAAEIGKRYKYIFVDEYQDTNRVQDELFRAVGAEAVRFMVGDIKQSIYRFRGADPRVFSSYRRIWEKVSPDGEDCPAPGGSIFMSENFRSAPDVIRFINAVSDHILPFGGIPYEPEDALLCGKQPYGDEGTHIPAEIVLIDRKETAEEDTADEDKIPEPYPEAAYTAERIAAMLGRYSEDGSRILAPGDIAVLLRSPSADGEAYRKALEARGIPAETKTARPLGEYASVMLLVCLLSLIDNPLRDIPAAGAMRSSLFGFTTEDLVLLRRMAGDLPLYTAVLDCAAQKELADADADADSADSSDSDAGDAGTLAEKCRRLTDFLDEEKTVLGGVSADRYLENLLLKTDFFRLTEIRENGSERDAVQRVLDLARAYERSRAGSGQSIGAFLEYLRDAMEQDAQKPQSSTDAVSICSIHASKGLEYPVCFLCGTAKKRNDQDERRTILFDDVLGFGMQLPDSTGLIRCDNLIRRAIGAKMADDAVEEEMRMLYVALTRAQTKLIVTAKVDHAEKWLEECALEAEFADEYTVKNASSYMDWIAASVVGRKTSPSWQVRVVRASEIGRAVQTAADESDDTGDVDEELLRELRCRADAVYPYGYLEKIPAKLVVSRLEPEILDEDGAAEIAMEADEQPASAKTAPVGQVSVRPAPVRPAFMRESGDAKANEVGSAVHRFLQFADFHALARDGIEAEKSRLVEREFLAPADASLIPAAQIERFVQSALFRSLLESAFVKREFRFNVLMDAAEFTADEGLKEKLAGSGTKITVQGVVDCVYRDADSGKLVLIDYKTDAVYADEWKDRRKAYARLREKHRNQLSYYREICSRLFEEEIEEAYIYSTVLGSLIRV